MFDSICVKEQKTHTNMHSHLNPVVIERQHTTSQVCATSTRGVLDSSESQQNTRLVTDLMPPAIITQTQTAY